MVACHFPLSIFLTIFLTNRVLCLDIRKTDIKVVTDENRHFTLNPDATYLPFRKIRNAKGNIIFTLGDRIDGDRLVSTHMEQNTFGRLTDVEVSIWYPAECHNGYIVSSIEIITEVSTDDADAYLVNDLDFKNKMCLETLIAVNKTFKFGYQIYIYGY